MYKILERHIVGNRRRRGHGLQENDDFEMDAIFFNSQETPSGLREIEELETEEVCQILL